MTTFSQREYDSLRPVRTRPAFTGLVHRAGAFLFDGIVFYGAAWALAAGLRPALLALNPLLPWLGQVGAFLYFFLMESPLGRGRSVGKTLFNQQVVTAAGTPPGWAAAFRRALLKSLVVLALVDPVIHGLIFPAASLPGSFIALLLLPLGALGYLIALALSVSIHPYKRGFHDLWAGTFVTGDPTPQAFLDALATPPDDMTLRRLRVNPRMSLIFLVGSVIFMLIRPIHGLRSEESRERLEDFEALQPEGALEGYRLVNMFLPDAVMAMQFNDGVTKIRNRTDEKTAPTTDSLRASVPSDGTMIIVQALRRSGAIPKAADVPAGLIAEAEALRAQAWQVWQEREPLRRAEYERMRAAGEKITVGDTKVDPLPPPAATRFRLALIEPFQILLYNKPAAVRLEGPADPAAGPLEVTPESIPRPPQPVAPRPEAERAEADARAPRNADNPTTGGR